MKYVVYDKVVYVVISTFTDYRGNQDYSLERLHPKPNHVTPYVKAPVGDCKPWDGTAEC